MTSVRSAFSGRVVVLVVALLSGGARAAGPRTDPHMTWWRQSRVGMLVHWGLFSVPAGTWKGKPVPGPAEGIMRQGKIKPREYRRLAERFRPARFEPAKWARIAHESGIRYVGITAKHHDGFALWKSGVGEFSVAKGSWGRDVVAELGLACRQRKLGFGVGVSVADWCGPAGPRWGPAHRARLTGQVRELTTDYSDVLLLWLDAGEVSPPSVETARELVKLARKHKPRAIVGGAAALLDGASDVRSAGGAMPDVVAGDWEYRLPVAGSAGYKAPALDCKPTKQLVRTLVEVASRGGNLLLEVPATADGKIPITVAARLLGMGRWLRANGRSIYGTQGSTLGRPSWGRSTHRDGEIYLHVLDWPAGGRLEVPSPKGTVIGAYLLADEKKPALRFSQEQAVVQVHLPEKTAEGLCPVVVLKVDGGVTMSEWARARLRAPVVLHAKTAKVHGKGKLAYEFQKDRDNLGFWHRADEWASWDFAVQQAGEYAVEMTHACPANMAGNPYVVVVAGQEIKGVVKSTGDWGRFQTTALGRVRLPTVGRHTLSVKPVKIRHKGALMNLQSVTLRLVR